MKLQFKNDQFHCGNIAASIQYTVSNSSAMMNILSNSLYSDKIKAVVRELSTNAFESHFKNGNNTEPFDVYLPTYNNKEFQIRDYGTGLSLNQIKEMYTVYGVSDKSNSNEYTGCLGLGSKSPFAYTDSFTTISYYNGKKYTIVNAKDKSGIPRCNVLSVSDTNEPNGIAIIISVKEDDITTFTRKASEIYEYFNVIPAVKRGKLDIREKKCKLQSPSKDWAIYNHRSQVVAVMGQVSYPINKAHFDGKYSDIFNTGVDINFDIGEIEMDAAREGLQYHKQTINAITKKLDDIIDLCSKDIKNKISSCKSLWEASCVLYNEKRDNYFLLRLVSSSKFTWNDKPIQNHFNVQKFPIISHKTNFNGKVTTKNIVTNIYAKDVDKIRFYVADTKTGFVSGTRQVVREDPSLTVFLLKDSSPTILQEVSDELGLSTTDFIKTSSLPKIKKSSTKIKTATKQYGELYNCDFDGNSSKYTLSASCWYDNKLDINNTNGVYLELKNWTIITDRTVNNTIGFDEFYRFTVLLEERGIKLPNFVGVKTQNIRRISSNNNWISLQAWLKRISPLVITNNNIAIYNLDKMASKICYRYKYSNLLSFLTDQSTVIYKLCELCHKSRDKNSINIIKIISKLLSLTNMSCVNDIDGSVDTTMSSMVEQCDKQYPLLEQCLFNSSSDSKYAKLNDYVNLFEQVKKQRELIK